MLNPPKTLEEAQAYRYGKWAGNPKGHSYKREYCACQVFPQLGEHYQCQRKNGHGPDNLYCKQHAKILAPT